MDHIFDNFFRVLSELCVDLDVVHGDEEKRDGDKTENPLQANCQERVNLYLKKKQD